MLPRPASVLVGIEGGGHVSMVDLKHSARPIQPGDVIGDKFRVERVLGKGGMGIVVAARHRDLGHLVAIKILLDSVFGRQGILQRFLQEARAAVRLRSEHVTRVLDVGLHEVTGSPEGTPPRIPFIVMEYLEGESLGQLSRQRALSVREATEYIAQACDALSEAHGLGIIHRDLKPENLFLTRRPNGAPLVKVLDFGISRVPGGDGEGARLTGTTDVMGTPHYMSPEQMRAVRDAGPRSDVWALGVTLFELLTGRVPFPGTTVTEICASVLTTDPPRPTSLRGDLPEALEALILRCLQKVPERRFQSAEELRSALLPFTSEAVVTRQAAIHEAPRQVTMAMDDQPTLQRTSIAGPGSPEPRAVATITGTAVTASGAPTPSRRRMSITAIVCAGIIASALLGLWLSGRARLAPEGDVTPTSAGPARGSAEAGTGDPAPSTPPAPVEPLPTAPKRAEGVPTASVVAPPKKASAPILPARTALPPAPPPRVSSPPPAGDFNGSRR